MDKKEIELKVKKILADRLDIDIKNIKSHSDLLNDLGMDSLGSVEVTYEIEEVFKINILEDTLKEVKTVKDIVDYIEKLLA